jgi:hypothetical protein
MVYIEWDKDHWAYNGEPDRWAFESHFDPVEDKKMPDSSDFTPEDWADYQAFQAFRAMQKAEGKEDSKPEPKPEPGPGDSLDPERYEARVNAAIEMLREGNAFIVITVDREESEGSTPAFAQNVLTGYKSPEAGLLAELQLSRLGTVAFQSLTFEALQKLISEGK